MKKLIINTFEADTLAIVLENSGGNSFNIKQIRRLNSILDIMEKSYKVFREAKQEIIKKYSGVLDTSLRNQLMQEDFEKLKTESKLKSHEFEFDDEEWGFLFEIWNTAQFQGFKEARELALSLDKKINKTNST